MQSLIWNGKLKDPLPNRLCWQDMVDQMGCGLAHTSCSTARAEPPAFAAKRDQVLEVARLTLGSQESVRQDPATEILGKLLGHKVWQCVASVTFDLCLELEPVVLHDLVEDRLLGLMPSVGELVVCGISFDHEGKSCISNPAATMACVLVERSLSNPEASAGSIRLTGHRSAMRPQVASLALRDQLASAGW